MKKAVFVVAGLILLAVFVTAVLLNKAETVEQAEQVASLNSEALSRPEAPSFGPADARVTIVEFLDPACGTCRRFYPLVKAMMAEQPDRIRLVVRHVPFHENVDQVVALLLAAERQGKYREALEALLDAQDEWVAHHVAQPERAFPLVERLGLDPERLRADMNDPAIAARIRQDMDDARALGVEKTPEFFVNGRPMPSFGHDQLKQLVDRALAEAYR